MPVIDPRLSLTLVEPGVAKVLDRYGLGVPDLKADVAALWRRFALEASDVDLDAAFATALRDALAAVDALESVVVQTDRGMKDAVGAAHAKVEKALRVLETKTVRAEKKNHDVIRQRLVRARAALWPDGALQERALNPLVVVARHGVGALQAFVEAVPFDVTVHHVVRP